MENKNYSGPAVQKPGEEVKQPLMNDHDEKIAPSKDARDLDASFARDSAEVEIKQPPKFIGLTKAELEQYENDPFYSRLRMALFILFWIAWIAMFVAAIAIVITSPKCPEKAKREWWQKKMCYQLYTRSFKDSNGDGIGDINGIIEQLPSLKKIGVQTVWPVPLLQSDETMSEYATTDYNKIDSRFGDRIEFDHLVRALNHQQMYLILDFVPMLTSIKHQWFQEAKKAGNEYTNCYYLRDSPGSNTSMWSPLETESGRKYYRHFPGVPSRPFINLLGEGTCLSELKKSMHHWLEKGVDGFYIPSFGMSFKDSSDDQDWDGTIKLLDEFRTSITTYQNETGSTDNFLLFSTVPADLNEEIRKRLVSEGGLNYVINNAFASVNSQCKAECLHDILSARLEYHDQYNFTWPMWEMGHPYVSRLATRVGSKERSELMNMLLLMLPGSITNYYGDSMGIEDVPEADIKINSTRRRLYVHRSPMQWSADKNAGFSTKDEIEIPVNKDYQTNNFEVLYSKFDSPLKTFKKLANLRQTDDTFIYGDFKLGPRNETVLNNILTLIRVHEGGFTFLAALNFGENTTTVNFMQQLGPLLNGKDTKAASVAQTTNLGELKRYQAREEIDISKVVLDKNQGIVLKYKSAPPK